MLQTKFNAYFFLCEDAAVVSDHLFALHAGEAVTPYHHWVLNVDVAAASDLPKRLHL
jgi:hypothetical protein